MKKIINDCFNNIVYLLPKKEAHRLYYLKTMKRKLNVDTPKNFNEKIQYLIINKYGKEEAKLSDKIKVKEYVSSLNIKNLHVPAIYETYNKEDKIDLDKLPDHFVLKCNHGSGDVFICKDKSKFDIENIEKKLKKVLDKDFAKKSLEYHYSMIKPMIYAEEYLDDKTNTNPVDYKFYVFNGKVKNILVCTNREKGLQLNDYDLKWNMLDNVVPKYKGKKIEKPYNLDEMIKIAEELSGNIPFVRVDLYNINGKVYFGEYTFTPAAGTIKYYNEKALNEYGDMLDLKLYEETR